MNEEEEEEEESDVKEEKKENDIFQAIFNDKEFKSELENILSDSSNQDDINAENILSQMKKQEITDLQRTLNKNEDQSGGKKKKVSKRKLSKYKCGEIVIYTKTNCKGIIKYIGTPSNDENEIYYGIVLNKKDGDCDGSFKENNIRYFIAKQNEGIYVTDKYIKKDNIIDIQEENRYNKKIKALNKKLEKEQQMRLKSNQQLAIFDKLFGRKLEIAGVKLNKIDEFQVKDIEKKLKTQEIKANAAALKEINQLKQKVKQQEIKLQQQKQKVESLQPAMPPSSIMMYKEFEIKLKEQAKEINNLKQGNEELRKGNKEAQEEIKNLKQGNEEAHEEINELKEKNETLTAQQSLFNVSIAATLDKEQEIKRIIKENKMESFGFIDGLFLYLKYHKIGEIDLQTLNNFLNKEEYDSDAIEMDVLNINSKDNININSSNIQLTCKNKHFWQLIIDYTSNPYGIYLILLNENKFNQLSLQLKLFEWDNPQIKAFLSWCFNEKIHPFQKDFNRQKLNKFMVQYSDLEISLLELYSAIENVQYSLDNNNNNCLILSCQSLIRMIAALQYYQQIENVFEEKETKETKAERIGKYFENSDPKQLMTDFHHLLLQHLNGEKEYCDIEFATIHKACKQHIYCNINKCTIFKRYNRNRDIKSTEINIINNIENETQIDMDILDTIHCYFMHSLDIGYRKTNSNNSEMEDINMAQTLITESKQLHELKASKFISISNVELEENKEEKGYAMYCFGHRFYYWDEYEYKDEQESYLSPNRGYKYSQWYIPIKFDNGLKDELLNNSKYPLHIQIYQQIYLKSLKYLQCTSAKRIKCNNGKYGIRIGTPLSFNHLFSVCLYTDLSNLCTAFSKTFRKLNMNESDEELKTRNGVFWHFCKYLREAVECYGTSLRESASSTFYHGVSIVLSFTSFISYFCTPTSTTRHIEVALNFATRSGMILELSKESDYGWDLTYFNCTWISCFANEDELLFFGGAAPLELNNIRIIMGNKNLINIIQAIKLLNILLTNKKLSIKNTTKKS